MLTYEEFELATGKETKFGYYRGKRMKIIDLALNHYHKEIKTADPKKHAELLAMIITACADWLKVKCDQKKDSKLYHKRRGPIKQLAEAALDEFQKTDSLKELFIERQGRLYFDRNKINTLGKRGALTKPLELGYISERELSDSLKKGEGKRRDYVPSGAGAHNYQSGLKNTSLNENQKKLVKENE